RRRYSEAPSHQPGLYIVIASRNSQASRAWVSRASIQTAAYRPGTPPACRVRSPPLAPIFTKRGSSPIEANAAGFETAQRPDYSGIVDNAATRFHGRVRSALPSRRRHRPRHLQPAAGAQRLDVRDVRAARARSEEHTSELQSP